MNIISLFSCFSFTLFKFQVLLFVCLVHGFEFHIAFLALLYTGNVLIMVQKCNSTREATKSKKISIKNKNFNGNLL